MTKSPVITFGLCATAAVLSAKCGKLSQRDAIHLAIVSLRHLDGDSDAQRAVADFLELVERAPQDAGAALERFLQKWVQRIPSAAADELTEGASLFDWQNRADMQ